jgi:hypothetical protein
VNAEISEIAHPSNVIYCHAEHLYIVKTDPLDALSPIVEAILGERYTGKSCFSSQHLLQIKGYGLVCAV